MPPNLFAGVVAMGEQRRDRRIQSEQRLDTHIAEFMVAEHHAGGLLDGDL
jgi:hypothetical protein